MWTGFLANFCLPRICFKKRIVYEKLHPNELFPIVTSNAGVTTRLDFKKIFLTVFLPTVVRNDGNPENLREEAGRRRKN